MAVRERDVVLEHGEGTVFADKKGRIRAERTIEGKRRTFYEDEHGKRFASEKAARIFLRRLAEQLDCGRSFDASRQTLGDFLDHWLANVVKLQLAENTYRSYEQNRRLYFESIASVPIGQLTSTRIQEFIGGLCERRPALTPSTVSLARDILRAALAHAVAQKVLSSNPAGGRQVSSPRIPKREPHFLAPDEADRFLAAAKGDRYQIAFALALALGLRISEVLRLRWEHVDVERRILLVPGTKSDRSLASLHIPRELIPALRRAKAAQAEWLLGLGIQQSDSTFVCATASGVRAVHNTFLNRRLKRILKSAGLSEKLRFHDLRHTCASLLLHQGNPMQVVKEIMRHASIRITIDLYGHLMPGAVEGAMEKMGQLFTGF